MAHGARAQDRLVGGVSRRALLGLGLAAIPLTRARADRADAYAVFGTHSPQLEARLKDWQSRTKGYAQQLAASQHPNVIQFRRSLATIPSGLSAIRYIAVVNKAVNAAAPYIADYKSMRGRDQWATPMEFLEHGGDCEDFALTKAATLSHLGWPLDSMYLLVGVLDRPRAGPTGHAVLVVVLGDNQDSHFVLDNVSDRVVGLRQYHRLTPIYALDSRGVMMFVAAR